MINKHKSNKIKENSNTVRHWNNGTDHRHSKSCCDKSSPARRTKRICIKTPWQGYTFRTTPLPHYWSFGFNSQNRVPVIQFFDGSFVVSLVKPVNKQSSGRWYETPTVCSRDVELMLPLGLKELHDVFRGTTPNIMSRLTLSLLEDLNDFFR